MLCKSFKDVWPPNDPQWGHHSWGPLLKPTGEEHGTSPTPEEEATLLGKNIEPPQVCSLQEQLEIPRFVEPAKQSSTPSASSPFPMPRPSCLPSGKAKKSKQGMKANPNNPGRWVHSYLQSTRMVERIVISPLLHGWMLRWHPDPRVGLTASCHLQAASHTMKKRWLMDCPTLPRGAGAQGLPSSKGF